MNYSNVYYKLQREELVQHVLKGKNRILDVGCAEGFLGESLKKNGLASEVVGIEVFPGAALQAASRLDQVICEDLENLKRNCTILAPQSFDYILCGDVLEHLRDPWQTFTWLATLLKEDGLAIVSVPNVRHWSVLVPLLFKGEWHYRDHGIMDRTHLRFFTKKTAKQLLVDAGLNVEFCQGCKLRRKKDRLLNFIMLGMGKGFVSVQWILTGRKQGGRIACHGA